MRLITPRNAGPASVNKYLLPHEHQVITVRKHPAVLIVPIALALGAILISIVVGSTILLHTHDAVLVLLVICLIFLAYLGFKAWEWSEDYFSPRYHRVTADENPLYAEPGPNRSLRGGSFLCHDSYCNRYRVAARSSNTADSSAGNIGFRVVRRDVG